MSTNNTDLTKMLMLFEGKEAKKKDEPKEKIDEFKMKPTPKSKKGMFKGKTKEELKAMAAATKKKMKSHEDKGEKVPEALRSKMAEINFALRAKNDWGKAESTEKKPAKGKKVVKEDTDIEFKQLKAYITENFWGGGDSPAAEEETDDQEDSGSGEEEPHYDGSSEEGSGSSEEDAPEDVLKMDVPVFLKFLEYARENSKSDEDLHELAEKMIKCSEGGEKTLTMADYEECCSDNCDSSGSDDSEFGSKKSSAPEFGRSNEGSGSSDGDGYDRSVQAESIRNIMNKLGML
jgi:hypothetical protein